MVIKMKLSIISFTEKGLSLSKRLTKVWKETEVILYTKCTAYLKEERKHSVMFVDKSIKEWTKEQMEEKNALLFIGACGIAVRSIAPCIVDKLHDSPVLVMDERGEYIIPILSGHMGGANEMAHYIAEKIKAVPVITTATDINGMFAVDLFAKKNKLHIIDKEGIAKVSSKVLAGQKITISIENGHICEDSPLPEELILVSYPPTEQVDIVVTSKNVDFDATIRLRPKEYVIGMGCKKGMDAEKIEDLIKHCMEKLGITSIQLLALASIEQKCREQGFLIWSRKYNVPFLTYNAEQLQGVEGNFSESSFVKDTVGVGNVCERAALKACGDYGNLILKKYAENGMTIAVARREWSVAFYEA